MKIDTHGNLFAAGPGGIYVLAPDGTYLGGFDMEVPTANCAWGNDGSTLYIAEHTAIDRVKTATKDLGFKAAMVIHLRGQSFAACWGKCRRLVAEYCPLRSYGTGALS